jgi:hypothetical protein
VLHDKKKLHDSGGFTKGKKSEDDPRRNTTVPFPEEEAVMSIYGGAFPHES